MIYLVLSFSKQLSVERQSGQESDLQIYNRSHNRRVVSQRALLWIPGAHICIELRVLSWSRSSKWQATYGKEENTETNWLTSRNRNYGKPEQSQNIPFGMCPSKPNSNIRTSRNQETPSLIHLSPAAAPFGSCLLSRTDNRMHHVTLKPSVWYYFLASATWRESMRSPAYKSEDKEKHREENTRNKLQNRGVVVTQRLCGADKWC
ncbi:uncharacterized protein CLUP02_10260 [Colletotrichum lupini]|uniref:Uncharacterized protein n=1 Tax=Colletotrichum lupini TaxID=145971 RepID=A0A9Q8SWA2_9PEZI|nr:uncharacterized protein CLUP02_10260 [Colletotrichum lupini]UQC84764.1 hypothetical protein CLUP02_10260 [Colletotrichum lupini]